LTNAWSRIDDSQIQEAIPHEGPLIVIINHVNFFDIPLFFTRIIPRPVAVFARHDSWDNPVKRGMLSVWGGFPVHRGEADLKALRWGLEMLEARFILTLAPEGTRSGHGSLQEGKPGAVFLALRSGVPVLPVVMYKHETIWEDFKRLRRANSVIKAGRPFRIVDRGERVTSKVRRQMADEMMFQMAATLPPEYRGVYANESKWTEKYIQFVD
jgi:1-acyl-sn-glycerol-3-phosphate acyltransferase